MIDVLIKLANGEIKDQTTLEIYDSINILYTYTFNGESKAFYNKDKWELSNHFEINDKFLNSDVKLIPPKEKKYLVKLHIKGLLNIRNYLNYYNDGIKQWIELGNDLVQGFYQTRFTKNELQSIQPVREFLEDMQGKYELIEVEDNEDD